MGELYNYLQLRKQEKDFTAHKADNVSQLNRVIKSIGHSIEEYPMLAPEVNDTGRLQRAINDNTPIIIPIDTHLVVSATIESNANRVIIIGVDPLVCSIKQANVGLDLFHITSNECSITGVKMMGMGTLSTSGRLIHVKGVHAIVDNCIFEDCDYVALGLDITSGEVIVTRNWFINSYAEDIAYRCNKVFISKNFFISSRFNAIVARGVSDSNITDNYFENCGMSGMDATVDIRNNFAATPLGCNRVSVTNNKFVNCYVPLHSLSETTALHKNITVEDNEIYTESPTAENFIGFYNVKNFKFNRNNVFGSGTVRSLIISGGNSSYVECKGNTFSGGVAGVEITADGLIDSDDNTFMDLTGVAYIARGATARTTIMANNNKYINVDVGFKPLGSFLGNITMNNCMFKNVATMAVILTNNITRLTTIGNTFVDGNIKAIQVLAQPDVWVKGKNLGYDLEFGSTANRPSNPTVGQFYVDMTLGKPIACKSINPSVWIDGVGTTV